MTDAADIEPAFQVVNTRRLAFSQARVFEAFSDPEQLALWWGPHGFTNRFDHFDLRTGGRWLFTMINENGKMFDNIKEFIEVTAPQRIVFRHLEPMHDFVMTIGFDPAGDETDLTWIMDFAPGQDSGLAPFLHTANEQNFDRLQTFLETH